MMLKVSRKEKNNLKKEQKALAKKRKVTAKQHSMHAFMILTTVSCIDFNKAYPSIDMFIDG